MLTWFPSHEELPDAIDAEQALDDTDSYWRDWAHDCTHHGDYHEEIHSSLLMLKALTYAPTGGIVAAPTTSLPEWIGGVRNWDYRFCWLRDATLTLLAMLQAGYNDEADRLARMAAARRRRRPGGRADHVRASAASGASRSGSSAGSPGTRARARCGSATRPSSSSSSTSTARCSTPSTRRVSHGAPADDTRLVAGALVCFPGSRTAGELEDAGIWEVRGPPRHFTHSKVMAWVAFDRAVRAHEEFGREGPVERWRALRDEIHAEVLARGWSDERQAFVQSYGSHELDASVLADAARRLPAARPTRASSRPSRRSDAT